MDLTQKRIDWIDALKGFATVCVVVGHISDGYLGAGMFVEKRHILNGIFNSVYIFHMALFFMISGMTYKLAYFRTVNGIIALKDPQKIKRQLCNLILLYVLYCIWMILFKVLFSKFVNKPVSLKGLFFIWGKPIYPYWYLYVLILYYAIFTFGVQKKWGSKPLPLIALLGGASLLSGFCDTSDWFQVQHTMQYAIYFYLGIILVGQNRQENAFVNLIPIFISLVTIIFFWNDKRYITNIPLVNTIAAFGCVILFAALFRKVPFLKSSFLFTLIGKHALEIYLLHCFFTAGNRVLLPMLGIHGFWSSFVINLFISIFIPMAVSFVSKKLGLYKLLFAPGKVFL